MCCYQGKITLPPLQPAPEELRALLTSRDPDGSSFRRLIRNYNNALAMTSVGRKLDNSINSGPGRGPYTFKIHGQLSHRAGSLLPPEPQGEGEDLRAPPPIYAQLYIYDQEEALNYRTANRWNDSLNEGT